MADDAVAVEHLAEGLQEVGAVLLEVLNDVVEGLLVDTFGVVFLAIPSSL